MPNNLQVILTQDVNNLGKAGELVSVRAGYGRNYLVPRGLAVSATVRNKNRLEHEKALIERKVAKERASATEIAAKINVMTLQFERIVGEDEKLFGSVSNRDIQEQLKRAGVDIDHRWIQLDGAVKALGKYEVPVRLAAGVTATLKFWVVGKEK
jgi:large subunit ribosomal protein L9